VNVSADNPRVQVIGDAAIAILAGQGMRGLTHRAVDRAAGLPPGTTSNYARTRSALLELALGRMNELESALMAPATGRMPATLDEFAEAVATVVHASITTASQRIIARYELALESTRRPELRAAYDSIGFLIRAMSEGMLAAVGSADPASDAYALVSWTEGVMFYALAGSGHDRVPGLDDLRAQVATFLNGLVHAGQAPAG
jgi:DNA-binding transcriptional regulator YbjK